MLPGACFCLPQGGQNLAWCFAGAAPAMLSGQTLNKMSAAANLCPLCAWLTLLLLLTGSVWHDGKRVWKHCKLQHCMMA
jgi:hypothetical protein